MCYGLLNTEADMILLHSHLEYLSKYLSISNYPWSSQSKMSNWITWSSLLVFNVVSCINYLTGKAFKLASSRFDEFEIDRRSITYGLKFACCCFSAVILLLLNMLTSDNTQVELERVVTIGEIYVKQWF